MKILLERGDTVQMLPFNALLDVFNRRNFFSNDETRERIAREIADKTGIVEKIELKYATDFFYFKPEDCDHTYSIPYESITFALNKQE